MNGSEDITFGSNLTWDNRELCNIL